MNAIGIIAEYNPFHNGHLYHINKVKELYPDHAIIVVLGGNFLQRGEPSIINKWDKTTIALEYGADMVIELPFVFATQAADIFAKGSIEILKHLNVDYVVFGSESNDINLLTTLADIQLNNKSYNKIVKEYMDQGINYPSAMAKALEAITNKKIDKPNDILGICYIKEILRQQANITPKCIQRTNDYHSLELNGDIASASSVRNALKNNNMVKDYVPKLTYEYLKKELTFYEDYFTFIKYKILTDINNLDKYQTVDEGIDNKIRKYIVESKSLEELINNIKSKRYTRAKIQRMLTHILVGFTKEEALNNKDIKYVRVLGFNNIGREYLNKIKKKISIPIIAKYSKQYHNLLQLDLRSTYVYACKFSENEKKELIEKEYKNSLIIKSQD
jgi:predicted nucleotidyltransferase